MSENKEQNNFIEDLVEKDISHGTYGGEVVTRFPPEPNGYLHIGHAKSICLNFGIASRYGGRCHLRFDDTNPTTENPEYVSSIQNDVKWLGFDWGDNLFFASDYFPQLYKFAIELIKSGKAYVDSLSESEIREYRGTVTEPGKESPYRDRSVDENMQLFLDMKAGKYSDGEHVLRAKLDMSSPNMKLRDPLLYRIKHAHHYRTGAEWCIYPMYDFAHPLSDAIERITHSLCTLEFENNHPIYDWVVENLFEPPRPQQYEFARLNLNYTVMSKRKLLRLVEENHVDGWDDPRMHTIAGLRRRGYTASSIRSFSNRVGVARANSRSDIGLLEYSIRDDLNLEVKRVMAVLRPLKIDITNYPEGHVDWLDAPYYPHDVPKEGTRKVPFSKVVYIDESDFQEVPQKKFYRLSPGSEVRLRYGYVIRCTDVVKDAAGNIVELKCTYDPESRGGDTADGRKVRGTIQWVAESHAVEFEARLYDRLFIAEDPEDGVDDFVENLNPASKEILENSLIEPSVLGDAADTRYQFEREGYFWRDPVDSADSHLVFNRIVSLRDSWAKVVVAEKATGKSEARDAVATDNKDSSSGDSQPVEDTKEVVAFAEAHDVTREVARQLLQDEGKRALFNAAAEGAGDLSGAVANWIVNELGDAVDVAAAPLLVSLVQLVDTGVISHRAGRDIQEEVFETGVEPSAIVEREGLAQVSDPDRIAEFAAEIVAQNRDKVAAYNSGKTGLLGFFVGQVMKASGGKANPEVAKAVMLRKLEEQA